jgi:hypothetical protein
METKSRFPWPVFAMSTKIGSIPIANQNAAIPYIFGEPWSSRGCGLALK